MRAELSNRLESFELLCLYKYFLICSVRPLTVKIEKDDDVLSAGRRYSAKCVTTGSRPAALITWHKGRRQLKKTKVCYFLCLYIRFFM